MQTAGFVSCRKIGPSNSINRAKFHCEFAGDGHIRKYVRYTKTYVRWKAIRTCKDKKEAVLATHKACMLSIITSGISFFAATFGVAAYSKVDMIGAICTLLSRGALISMAVVICILPAMLWVFDPLICVTTLHFTGKKEKTSKNEISKEQPSA